MAHCPNCGRKLHLYNWRPECPDCGVNMVYFKSNERLLAESEAAEIAHAKSQPSIDRAKASFFGSPLAIVRIVLSLLPIGGLFLPVFNGKNIIGVYNYINENNFGAVLGNVLKGNLISISVLTLLVSAVMILVCLGCTVMSLGKHGTLRNFIFNLFMMLNATASAVCITIAASSASVAEISGKVGIGAFVYIGLMLILLVYNLILGKKGLLKIKKTLCLIGGLPSDEYFAYIEQGMSDIEIRKRMVEALTKMQNEVRAKAAEAEQHALDERAHRK